MSFHITDTRLLCQLGEQAANLLLPSPLRVVIRIHDTGQSARILGIGDVLIWYGSEWFSSQYEFNDRDKVGGLQPGCEDLGPIIETFLQDCSKQLMRLQADREEAKKQAQARRDADNLQATLRALGF